jgi:hypothetical protein
VEAKARVAEIPAHRFALTMDQVWAAAVVLVAVGVTLALRIGVVDLAYHIRAGESVLVSGHAPAVDAFTFSVAGRAWLDQQWGAQAIVALVYRAGGWAAVALAHAALIGATFWFLWRACLARGASVRTCSALTMCGFLVSFFNMGMRPQALAYPLFTATLWILASRRTHPRCLWALPVLVAVWANIHGSFALAPVLIGLAWLEDRHDGAGTANTTAAVGAVATLATLVGPYGIGAWRYAIGITTNSRILGQILEWEPTSVRTVDGALFFLSVIAIVVFLARRGTQTGWLPLIWLGTFFLLALPAARGEVWWAFVFPVVVAGLAGHEERPSESDRRGNPTLNLTIVLALAMFVILGLPWFRSGVDPSSGSSRLLSFAPQGLVDATRRDASPTARLFVSQAFASWFEFASPSNPVFVDSRIELFPDRIWDDYLDVMRGRDGWQTILDRWDVDAVILQVEDTAISSLLATDPGWRLTYHDDLGRVFVRV